MNRAHSMFITAAGIIVTFAVFGSRDAIASGHGHDKLQADDHHAMSDTQHKQGIFKTAATKKGFAQKPSFGTEAVCPVTGKEFTVGKDTTHSVYKGKHYAFCCPACKPLFDKDPEKYIK